MRAGEPFVYAYYEGLDKVGHEYGLGDHYDAELQAVDHLVERLLAVLPPLVLPRCSPPTTARSTSAVTWCRSTPASIRWSWRRPARAASAGSTPARVRTADLLAAAAEAHPDAWVTDRASFLDGGWMGPTVGRDAAERLGDVAVVSLGLTSYDDPADTGPFPLVGRHGSMTADEMLVPLVAAPGPRRHP